MAESFLLKNYMSMAPRLSGADQMDQDLLPHALRSGRGAVGTSKGTAPGAIAATVLGTHRPASDFDEFLYDAPAGAGEALLQPADTRLGLGESLEAKHRRVGPLRCGRPPRGADDGRRSAAKVGMPLNANAKCIVCQDTSRTAFFLAPGTQRHTRICQRLTLDRCPRAGRGASVPLRPGPWGKPPRAAQWFR